MDAEPPDRQSADAAPDESTPTAALIEIIQGLAAREAAAGQSLSAHQRIQGNFRFLSWEPEDRGLGKTVALLATRDDPTARAACRRYLLDLPWGADRLATLSLLRGLGRWPRRERMAVLDEALTVHREPGVPRLWLWQTMGSADTRAGLEGMLGDLGEARDDATRLLYIESLDATLTRLALVGSRFDANHLAALAQRLDTRGWYWLHRGYFGILVAHRLGADGRRVSGPWERLALSLIGLWEQMRFDHMGCLVWLALLGLGAPLAFAGLDRWLGPPVTHGWLPVLLFAGWLLWAMVTVETHFTGHESLRFKWYVSLGYFGLLTGTLLTAVLVRIV